MNGEARKQEVKAKVDAIKVEKGCVDCGYNSHACALDFDHRVDSTKLFTISNGYWKSWELILEEIAKCDIVCANCHRVRTKEKGFVRRSREQIAADKLAAFQASLASKIARTRVGGV